MAKPKTSYTPASKPKSTFTQVAKNTSSFARIAKNAVSLTKVDKEETTYNQGGSLVDPWFMNSTFLQLDNTYYLLNGYGNIANQIGLNKPKTSYAAV